jgi:hypothetical protein
LAQSSYLNPVVAISSIILYQQRSVKPFFFLYVAVYNSIDKIRIMTPTTTPNPTTVDEQVEVLLTKELNQLSFKDRNDYQGK